MSESLNKKPDFSIDQANEMAAFHFGVSGSIEALPSERDQNFLIRQDASNAWVLKIANAATPPESLALQDAMATHLNQALERDRFPVSIAPKTGVPSLTVGSATGSHHCRLVEYQEGLTWAKYRPHDASLRAELGALLGRVTNALRGFKHPGAIRSLQWDLHHCADVIKMGMGKVARAEDRTLIERALNRYESQFKETHRSLRQSVIHGDANDHNLVVSPAADETPSKVALIDFGDALLTQTINEVAIALAYALFEVRDPIRAAVDLVAAFHEQTPLEEKELEVLPSLVSMRLATSVTQAALNSSLRPDDPYLTVSVPPALDLLKKLETLPRGLFHYSLRKACGFPGHPQTERFKDWLNSSPKLGPIVEVPINAKDSAVLDLSVGSPLALSADSPQSIDQATRRIADQLFEQRASVGLGRYNEARACYQAHQFSCANGNQRTIHLGLDLFLEPGIPVKAPLPGKIHSVQDNAQAQDYGPTVILEHRIEDHELSFYTLYGHLGRESIANLKCGQSVEAGETIGAIGIPFENGGWPPHLHFQVMLDLLGDTGNFPGVADPDHVSTWLDLCPNPAAILGLEAAFVEAEPPDSKRLLERRTKCIGPSLSLSYQTPLHIVQGSGQYLFDPLGRAYLDGVNNVCHVGHAHPLVVERITSQAALLNTNTRYLHEHLVNYAERLTALFPKPLEVCFFVCSGSEANDLALRIARQYTQSRETLIIDGAYHGNLSSTVEISPYKFDGKGGFTPPDFIHKMAAPDSYRGIHRAPNPDLTDEYAVEIETTLGRLADQHKGRPTFIAESILSCAGQIVLPPGYLKKAYELVRQASGLCIADEVQVGFGRVGTHFWAFETQDVVPDIVTLGKPIGNGHPLGAVITTREIADSFNNGMEYFNTFGGNPVSCSAGLGVLDVMQEEGLQEHALQVGKELLLGLKKLQDRFTFVGDVRGLGLFQGIEFVTDPDSRQPAPRVARYIVERLKAHFILLSVDGPQHNVIKIKPPLPFSREDCSRLLSVLEDILEEEPLKQQLQIDSQEVK